MSECNHSCDTCSEECEDRTAQNMRSFLRPQATVKKVIGIVSGKGGVGKSLVTALLACCANRQGLHAAILDADITGPSIPRCFGLHGPAEVREDALLPVVSRTGIQTMSINLLLEEETQPVIFRGPVIANTVKQFWSDVIWNDVDVLFCDMPPGTGDVPLTVFQSIPVDGVVVVTSPQQLVGMIVEKAVHMAQSMDIPILGLVENMSYYECPDCKSRHAIYGQCHIEERAPEYGIKNVVKLPVLPELAECCDTGRIEEFNCDWFDELMREWGKL